RAAIWPPTSWHAPPTVTIRQAAYHSSNRRGTHVSRGAFSPLLRLQHENEVVLADVVRARRGEGVGARVREVPDRRVRGPRRVVPLGGDRSREVSHVHREVLGSLATCRLVTQGQRPVGCVRPRVVLG